jgi:hypothetical protein
MQGPRFQSITPIKHYGKVIFSFVHYYKSWSCNSITTFSVIFFFIIVRNFFSGESRLKGAYSQSGISNKH